MQIRPLAPSEIPALAEGLAALPLMTRYRRDAGALSRALESARARGDGLLVADEGGVPRGLAWFVPSGTLALGGYLKLIAVLPGGEGKGTGAVLLRAFEAQTARACRPMPSCSSPTSTRTRSVSTSARGTCASVPCPASSCRTSPSFSTGSG